MCPYSPPLLVPPLSLPYDDHPSLYPSPSDVQSNSLSSPHALSISLTSQPKPPPFLSSLYLPHFPFTSVKWAMVGQGPTRLPVDSSFWMVEVDSCQA